MIFKNAAIPIKIFVFKTIIRLMSFVNEYIQLRAGQLHHSHTHDNAC